MFERYTEKARRTIFFARYEASQFGSQEIEVAHLLLGLAREDFPTIARVSGVERGAFRQAFEGLCQHSDQHLSTSVDIPLNHPCKRVLGFAAEESERIGHRHIGPEHMLLGVLRENGPEATVLNRLGVELEAARSILRPPADGSAAQREALKELALQVPDDRLDAAQHILQALASPYFAARGVSSEGPFSYSFGAVPPEGTA